MKYTFLLLCIGGSTLGRAQQGVPQFPVYVRDPAVTLYMTFAPGLGITVRNPDIERVPLMGQLTMPLRFRHNWYLIPEIYRVAFRSPKFPRMKGFFLPTYPRYRHHLYGLRFGRSFAPPDNGFSVLPSIGVDYLQIYEPYYDQANRYSIRQYEIYHLYSIPFQVDLRFQNKRESYAAFAIGMRYNKNSRRSFGSLTAGIEFKLN